MLSLVLPKGSLERLTFDLFEAADLAVRRSSAREYAASIDDPRIGSVAIMRPQEIPRFVADGHFDIGICGQDWVEETGADVVEVAPLPVSKSTSEPARIVIAMAESSGVERPEQIPSGVVVTTEYERLARRYFERLGVDATTMRSWGSNEAKVSAGIVDALIHNVETGETLRRNGLRVVDTLMETSTVIVANRVTLADATKKQAIDDLLILLHGAIAARGRVLVKLNVASDDLDGVLAILPSMKAPTVSPLAGDGAFAVETVVDKSAINTLIPRLKARGASDIIELPLSKIVP